MTRVFPPLLHLVMAVALLIAPILPGIAFADGVGTQHAAHATSSDDDHAHHAPHHGSAEETESPCAQHDGCHGQCCATCVQCFTATTSLAGVYAHTRPVQTPTVSTLLDSLLVTLLNRPPSVV